MKKKTWFCPSRVILKNLGWLSLFHVCLALIYFKIRMIHSVFKFFLKSFFQLPCLKWCWLKLLIFWQTTTLPGHLHSILKKSRMTIFDEACFKLKIALVWSLEICRRVKINRFRFLIILPWRVGKIGWESKSWVG